MLFLPVFWCEKIEEKLIFSGQKDMDYHGTAAAMGSGREDAGGDVGDEDHLNLDRNPSSIKIFDYVNSSNSIPKNNVAVAVAVTAVATLVLLVLAALFYYKRQRARGWLWVWDDPDAGGGLTTTDSNSSLGKRERRDAQFFFSSTLTTEGGGIKWPHVRQRSAAVLLGQFANGDVWRCTPKTVCGISYIIILLLLHLLPSFVCFFEQNMYDVFVA